MEREAVQICIPYPSNGEADLSEREGNLSVSSLTVLRGAPQRDIVEQGVERGAKELSS